MSNIREINQAVSIDFCALLDVPCLMWMVCMRACQLPALPPHLVVACGYVLGREVGGRAGGIGHGRKELRGSRAGQAGGGGGV